jgi:cytoskeletal protein RodZ
MDPIQKRELKRKAWMRLAAQRRRAGRLRGRVVAVSLICFVVLWGIVFAQMATGNDPVLSAKSSGAVASASRRHEKARAARSRATRAKAAEVEAEAEAVEAELDAVGPVEAEAEAVEAEPEFEEFVEEPEAVEAETEFVEPEPEVEEFIEEPAPVTTSQS